MDALAKLLDGPRGRGAVLLRVRMGGPWSMRLEDQAPLGLMAGLRGTAWLMPDGAEPFRLDAGSVLVVKGGSATIADTPGATPTVIVRRGWTCQTPTGGAVGAAMDLGVRTWGNRADGTTELLLACYQLRGEISRRVLDALPPYFLLEAGTWNDALVPVLAEEIGVDRPGQRAVLDRLFDLLLVSVLRDWFTRPEADAPAWHAAQRDPVVGAALRLLHDDPAAGWTVAGLAARTGVSRAVLARRFAELVGVPPMAYLKEWRLALAADLLLDPDNTLDAIARRVGYSDGFALSSVFKNARGISPQKYRDAADRMTSASFPR